jgi:hypothetical protein
MTKDTPSTPITFKRDFATFEFSMNDLNVFAVGSSSPVRCLSIFTVPATFGSLRTMWTYRASREYKAKVPPSPSSPALKTMNIYLTVTIKVNVQMMIERAPTRSS